MDIEELLAREAIRATLARYNTAGDARDYETLAGCFCEDGVMAVRTGEHAGRATILALLSGMAARRGAAAPGVFQRHHLATCRIVLTGPASADVLTYFSVKTELGLDHHGRYADVFRREAGDWLIARRAVEIDWFVEGSRFR